MFPRLGRFPASHAFAHSPRPRLCIVSMIPPPLERYCHEIFGPGAVNGPGGPNIASYSVPPHHKWSYIYAAHALRGAKK